MRCGAESGANSGAWQAMTASGGSADSRTAGSLVEAQAPAMAQAPAEAAVRRAVDRSSSNVARGGSIILVVLVAILLVGGATGIVVIGRSHAEPYILGFLAVLAAV